MSREPVGQRAVVTAVTDKARYEKTISGSALHVIVAKPANNGLNIVARGMNFNWNYNFEITPVEEYNTRFIQETVNGKMSLGSGMLATMELMSLGDQLPTYKDLTKEDELIVLQVEGDDEPNPGTVRNAFYGCKISGRAGGHGSTGIASQNVPFIFRKHLSGADFKLQNPSSPYPAEVQ